MTRIITRVLCLAGLLAVGLALASPAEAASCKKGYERIGSKCVKKCKKGEGRLNGTGKCQKLCKENEVRDSKGKCKAFLADYGDGCSPPVQICHSEELCDDQIWISAWVCSTFGYDNPDGCDTMSCECVEQSRSIDSFAKGSCEGS
jgi:hypothetical protein